MPGFCLIHARIYARVKQTVLKIEIPTFRISFILFKIAIF